MQEFIVFLEKNPIFFIILAFIIAALIGSFLNVVIHRLPIMLKREWFNDATEYLKEISPETLNNKKLTYNDGYPKTYNLSVPSSNCPKCKKNIKPFHNIPIIGWCMLKGKCNTCSLPISIRYPIIEFITALLISFLAFYFEPSIQFIFASILTFLLIILTCIDLDEMLLPDQITLPLIWIGLLINSFNLFINLNDAVIGAIVGYLSLWSIFWVFKLITKKEGMGYGDFKLLSVFGAWLGWQQLPLIILLSSVLAGLIGVILLISKKNA